MRVYYTDGSARDGKNQKGADNTGGWGVVCFSDTDENMIEQIFYGSEYQTTNNRMELCALLAALYDATDSKSDAPIKCVIYSDSAYVVNLYNTWIHTWFRNGWKNSKKKTVENLDLVQKIWKFAGDLSYEGIEVKKVNGHNGIIGNELADALATANFFRFDNLVNTNKIKVDDLAFI